MTYGNGAFSDIHSDSDVAHSIDTSGWMSTVKALDPSLNVIGALHAAGLGFTVSKRKCYFDTIAAGPKKQAESRCVLVRDDTETALHTFSNGYEPIQNEDAAAPLEVLRTEHGATLNSMGSMSGGKVCWAHLTLPSEMGVIHRQPGHGEDRHIANHILARWAHNGTSRLVYGLTPVEDIHCSNQLASAFAGVTTEWKISHTKNAHKRMAQTAGVFSEMQGSFGEMIAVLQGLEDQAMTSNEFIVFVAKWLQATKGDPGINAKSSDKVQQALDSREAEINELAEYFEHGINCAGKTKGDALMAITEKQTHGRDRAKALRGVDGLTADQRMRLYGSLAFGAGRANTSRALTMLRA